MIGVLLTWNPGKWPTDVEEREHYVARSKSDFGESWSVSNRKKIPEGTPAFLLAQGKYRGIVAGGRTTGEVFDGRHWLDGRKKANYVMVEFSEWIPLIDNLPTPFLEDSVPTVNWKPQNSGQILEDREVVSIDSLWTQHLDSLGIGYVRQPEEPDASEGFPEGTFKQVPVNRYERNRRARQRAIEIHGLDCKGCGFNFQTTYGKLGKDYIEVHHVVPISQIKVGYEVNPETDLVPLCANCHAMVHREKPPLKPEVLRKRLNM